jgi:hypothetical protein
MALLFIIGILFFIASVGFGIYYIVKGIAHKKLSYIKTGIICFSIALVSIIIPLWSIVGDLAEAFRN